MQARAEQADLLLDQFEGELGLPAGCPLLVENEAQKLLNLEPATLQRMTATECGEAAVVLVQFAFHLQRATNREQGRVRWAEETIRRLVAPRLQQQKGYGFEERRLMAVAEDEAATNADTLRVKAQLRLDRVSYLSAKVEALARSFTALQQCKRGRYGD